VSDYLADTSVFIAAEQGRVLSAPPAGAARISVATLTELHLGVRNARTERVRELRETTLDRAKKFIALSYDERVAERLAGLIGDVRNAGLRADVMDCIVAATALVHDLVVWTQDRDFDALASVAPSLRIHNALRRSSANPHERR
jgi:predicted nucleic acid-binding protein